MEQSIMEQFDNQSRTLNRSSNDGIINLRTKQLEPIFIRNKIDLFEPSYPITNMVIANNQLLLSMENFHLLKIDITTTTTTKPIEFDLNPYLISIKSPNRPIIMNLFIDYSGQHCLITVGQRLNNNDSTMDTVIQPYENFYIHRKLTILNKMKGYLITAVGWINNNNQQSMQQQCNNLLIGTNDGKIYETHLQSDDRFLAATRELSFLKLILDLSLQKSTLFDPYNNNDAIIPVTPATITTINQTNNEPICDIRIIRQKNNYEYCILIATRNFIYQYLGKITNLNNNDNQINNDQYIDGQPYLYQIIQNTTTTFKTFKEMPGYISKTKLDLYYQQQQLNNSIISFGWLTEPGIFYGEINNNTEDIRKMFDNANVIMYSDLNYHQQSNDFILNNNFNIKNKEEKKQIPKSFILTKFHLLLLYQKKLSIYCLLNKELIWEDKFGELSVENIVKDPINNTIWLFTKTNIYRYRIIEEDRNIWKIYLQKKDFDNAKFYAKNDLIKLDRTIYEEAMYYFDKKQYNKSAKLFTQTQSKTFEEIALKFIELDLNNNNNSINNQDALKEFLINKLKKLSINQEKTQIIILLLWIFELILNQLTIIESQINNADVDDTNLSKTILLEKQKNYENDIKTLINNKLYRTIYRENDKIFYKIILNHQNSLNIYEYFAEEINDFNHLIEYYEQNQNYEKILNLLKNEQSIELYYKYSTILIKYLPEKLINLLIQQYSNMEFDMKKLIPSLINNIDYNQQNQNKNENQKRQVKEMIRFLEYLIYNLKLIDSLIHNYYLALIIQYDTGTDDSDDKLIKYLNDITHQQQNQSIDNSMIKTTPFDLSYAARICLQNQQNHNSKKIPLQALLQLLLTMGAFEEAVEQALRMNNVELAKKIANQIQAMSCNNSNNQDLIKRLWLKIVKHVIENITNDDDKNNEFNITIITNLLQECQKFHNNNLLKIEDILIYLPKYLTIDSIKSAICQSLETYNSNIELLRDDMKLVTESAKQIRQDITDLRNRFVIINSNDLCQYCQLPILQEYFYSFPTCGHLFHHKCLIKELISILSLIDNYDKQRIELEAIISEMKSIQNQLQSNNSISQTESTIQLTNRLELLMKKLENLISAECLYCGNLMIETIDKPFINEYHDREQIYGWN